MPDGCSAAGTPALIFSSIINEEIGKKRKIRTLSVLHTGVEVPSQRECPPFPVSFATP